jgi:hypothetical protein
MKQATPTPILLEETFIRRLDKVRGGLSRGRWLELISEQTIHIIETTNTPVPPRIAEPRPDYAVEPKCVKGCEVLSGNILHAPGCPNIAAENLGEVDEGVIVETRKPSEVYDPLTPGGGVANALRFGDPLGPDADKDKS